MPSFVISEALLLAVEENFRPMDRSFSSLLEMLTSDRLTRVFLTWLEEFRVGVVIFSGPAKVGSVISKFTNLVYGLENDTL